MTSYTFRFDEQLKQVARTKSIPVQFDYQPNAETAEAIRELTAGETEHHELNSVEEMRVLMQKMATE